MAVVVACLVVGAAGVLAGGGAVALFSDEETVSGSFSVATDYDSGTPATNVTTPGNASTHENGTSAKNESTTAPGNGTRNGTHDRGTNDTALEVAAVSLSGDGELTTGEAATVTVRAVNRANESRELAATLSVDGTATATNTTTVSPNETASLTLSRTLESPGNYTLAAAGRVAGTVTVSAPVADIDVTDASVAQGEVQVNETVPVSATVANDGGANGSVDLVLRANGTAIDSRAVRLGPGERDTVEFDPAFEAAGSYDLTVDGVDAGTVLVENDTDLNDSS
ncbi:hypothetical protein L593_11460 [Salinarchaeum sp. Harcht-Bsk1]|nr:hypothetical protein L593_11460 [Salinarchaeum sp. Harcht-Bsk1]